MLGVTLAAMREDDVAHIGDQRAEAGLAGAQLAFARGELGGLAAQLGDVVRNPDHAHRSRRTLAPRQKRGLVQAAMHLDRTVGLHAAQRHAHRLSHLRQLRRRARRSTGPGRDRAGCRSARGHHPRSACSGPDDPARTARSAGDPRAAPRIRASGIPRRDRRRRRRSLAQTAETPAQCGSAASHVVQLPTVGPVSRTTSPVCRMIP